MEAWTTPPTFATGQVVSASGHLSALTDNVNVILGKYTAPQAPWSARTYDDDYGGIGAVDANKWRRIWQGYIRNKTDVLEWAAQVVKDSMLTCKVRLTYGTNTDTDTVAPGSGTVTVGGSLDVSTYSGFYFVALDVQMLNGTTPTSSRGDATVTPMYVHETDARIYTTLSRFYTGDTPSASNWQELSNRASTLYAQTGGVTIPFLGDSNRREWGNATTPMNISVWNGTVIHANRYIYYDLRVQSPELWPGGNAPNYGTLIALVKYNGTTLGGFGLWGAGYWHVIAWNGCSKKWYVFLCRADVAIPERARRHAGHEIDAHVHRLHADKRRLALGSSQNDSVWHIGVAQPESDSDPAYKRWVGTFDTNSLGLTEGTRYKMQVVAYDDIHTYGTNTTGMVKVMQLAEQPASNPTLGGWSTMPAWEHGDTVTGSGSVKAIRDNLAWLSSRIVYSNPATPWRNVLHPPLWFIQEYDWLHYYCEYKEDSDDDEPKPSIGFLYGNEWQEVSVPFEANKWLAYDLRGVAHLWPGTKYRLRDVTYAMEDSAS